MRMPRCPAGRGSNRTAALLKKPKSTLWQRWMDCARPAAVDVQRLRPRWCAAIVLLLVGTGAVLVPQVASAQSSPAPWAVVPSPNVRHSVGDPLAAVSCASPSACTAVGTRVFSNKTHTLIQSWNGKRWRNVRSPNAKGADFLAGVSCTSPAACVVVGDVLESGATQTLIESWNGLTWSIVPSPNVPNAQNALSGVSCSGPSTCTAVGYSNFASSVNKPLIESWNGSTWSIVPGPSLPPAENAAPGGGILHQRCGLHCRRSLVSPLRTESHPHRVMERVDVGDRSQPKCVQHCPRLPGRGFLHHSHCLRRRRTEPWRHRRPNPHRVMERVDLVDHS